MNTTFARLQAARSWPRLCLLALILLAFGRVTWRLDTHNFWWDESLSLQRAEQGWLALLRGELRLVDGFSTLLTIDQHPFFSFLLQGIFVRLAGDSEFVVRWPAAAAATLLTPVLWVFARRLRARGVVAPGTPGWLALLAAISPFYLWYGQEGRPYALWALLAVLSTYLLLRTLDHPSARLVHWLAYGLSLVAFLATHYLAVFLLPLHGLIVFMQLLRHHLRRALIGLGIVGTVAAAATAIALWQLIRPGAGDNLDRITVRVLVPDLLNAFSMGLSVNINDVWWLDLLFAGLALLGVGWGLRSRRQWQQGGWIVPLFVLLPVLILLVINLVRPAYMNARHLALISGGFLTLVAAGLAALYGWRRWLAAPLALLLIAGAGYSTVNYFTLPQYGKDHYAELGEYLQQHLLPGDLLLLNPPSSWRIFRYYLPLDEVDAAIANDAAIRYYGVPLLSRSMAETFEQLEGDLGPYRRIWHANSRTHPYMDPDNEIEAWLGEHTFQFRRERFYSPNSILALDMYLPTPPVHEGPPSEVAISHRVDVGFGPEIHLVGYDVGEPLADGFPTPVTLYWQVSSRPARNSKYILRLVERQADGTLREVAGIEREPYEGIAATQYWDPDKTIIEYIELAPEAATALAQPGLEHAFTLQLYDAETLAKLPIQPHAGAGSALDSETILLPIASVGTGPHP